MSDTVTTEPIDFCFNEDSVRAARIAFEKEFPCVRLTVVRNVGPCGWPEVTLTGRPDCVRRAIITAWDTGDDAENEWFVEQFMGAEAHAART